MEQEQRKRNDRRALAVRIIGFFFLLGLFVSLANHPNIGSQNVEKSAPITTPTATLITSPNSTVTPEATVRVNRALPVYRRGRAGVVSCPGAEGPLT